MMIEINIYFIITYIKCVLIVIIYNLLVVIVLCSASVSQFVNTYNLTENWFQNVVYCISIILVLGSIIGK